MPVVAVKHQPLWRHCPLADNTPHALEIADLEALTVQRSGCDQQLQKVTDACIGAGIRFTWEFDKSGSIHARHIVTDHGWKILLDRGLGVFQRYEMNEAFDLSNRLQQYRQCKAFEVTFLRQSS